MQADPVYSEDRLVPIAAGGGTIAAFDPVNGRIRMVGRTGDVGVPTGPGQYAIPGIPAIHRAALEGNRLLVTVEPFAAITHAVQARNVEADVPPGSTIEGAAPGDAGWIVVRTGVSTARLVALRDGSSTDVSIAAGERIVAVWGEGLPVVQSASGWRIGLSALRRGTVTSANGRALVARLDPKGRRDFLLVNALGTERKLTCPAGWIIDDAVVHATGTIASCLHPQLGYALWNGSTLERVDGTASLFSLGEEYPVVRTTGAKTGSMWRTGANAIAGNIEARLDIQVNPQVINGLPTVLISGKTTAGLVIALHGGPDSLEWDDLRYGGLYRTLADAGLATLIVNAPGSRGFGHELHEAGWDSWTAAADQIAQTGRYVADELRVRPAAVLGVSFGAWLAVQAADALGAKSVVAVSPVLDLTSHIQAHLADPEYNGWARQRFGAGLQLAIAGDRAGARCLATVTALVPEADRVVDPAHSSAVALGRGWQVVTVPEGHAPTTAQGAALRWAAIARALLTG